MNYTAPQTWTDNGVSVSKSTSRRLVLDVNGEEVTLVRRSKKYRNSGYQGMAESQRWKTRKWFELKLDEDHTLRFSSRLEMETAVSYYARTGVWENV